MPSISVQIAEIKLSNITHAKLRMGLIIIDVFIILMKNMSNLLKKEILKQKIFYKFNFRKLLLN